MSRKNKNRNEDGTLKYIVLITAILNLIKTLIDLISKLNE